MERSCLLAVVGAVLLFHLGCSEKSTVPSGDQPTPLDSTQVRKDTVNNDVLTPLPDSFSRRTLSLARTGCFGSCPVYEFHIFDDRTARFTGKAHVELIGTFEAKIEEELYEQIFAKAKELSIYSMEDQYPASKKDWISDLPSTYFIIYRPGGYKQIKYNHDIPSGLRVFSEYLDGIIDGLDWQSWEPSKSND